MSKERPAALRALVIDDERLARAEVMRHLARHPEIEVVAEATDGASAVEKIAELAPDVVFLDIQMPELDGFEVLQALSDDERPVVVFVTAYDEFALRAFEANAADYLLKPFDAERFESALARALVHVRDRSSSLGALLDDVAYRGRRATRIAARRGHQFHLLDVAEVERLEASRNYVLVHTTDGEFLARATLAALEKRLDPDAFLRIHRSHVVRIDAVSVVERLASGDVSVKMRDGSELPVARGHRQAVLLRLGAR